MIISINQPAYLPWLGYFDRIYNSDIHIVLDHVQFEKNSFVNRNKIINNQQAQMLTVPVSTKGKFGDLAINKVEIADKINWRDKHFRSISQSYSKAPFKENILPRFEEFYINRDTSSLNEMLKEQLSIFLDLLSLANTKIIYSSEAEYTSTKSDLIFDICTSMKATEYISGPLGRDYLDDEKFLEAGIKISYQDYNHPKYEQNSKEFISHVSTLDLLMNHGDSAFDILVGAE